MQQDYLLRQAELFGQVLAKILSNLLGVKNQGTMIIQLENQIVQEKLDLDIKELISTNTEQLIDILKNEKRFSNEDLEKIADILLLVANDETEPTKKAQLKRKCLTIYEYVQACENTYSFTLSFKIEKLRKDIDK